MLRGANPKLVLSHKACTTNIDKKKALWGVCWLQPLASSSRRCWAASLASVACLVSQITRHSCAEAHVERVLRSSHKVPSSRHGKPKSQREATESWHLSISCMSFSMDADAVAVAASSSAERLQLKRRALQRLSTLRLYHIHVPCTFQESFDIR